MLLRVCFTLFGLVISTEGARRASSQQRYKNNHNNAGLFDRSDVDCDSFGEITIDGTDWGESAQTVCKFWPPIFGSFPVNTTDTMLKFVEGITKKGGIADEVDSSRKGDTDFCWKATAVREVRAHSDECEMTSKGVCYGDCSRGYKPMALVGDFKPTCSSLCAESTLLYPCGFGCASSRWKCWWTVLSQVEEVTRRVGQVVSYLTGNPAISAAVDGVIAFAHFVVDVLVEVVKWVKDNWHKYFDTSNEDKAELTLSIFMSLAQSVVQYGVGKWSEFQDIWSTTSGLVGDVLDATLGWKKIDLNFIIDTISSHGKSIIDATNSISEVFDYPKCVASASAQVGFSIEVANEEAVLGPWDRDGIRDGKPRFVNRRVPEIEMHWNSWKDKWFIWGRENSSQSKRDYYRNDMDTLDYPQFGWSAANYPNTIMEIIPAAEKPSA